MLLIFSPRLSHQLCQVLIPLFTLPFFHFRSECVGETSRVRVRMSVIMAVLLADAQ